MSAKTASEAAINCLATADAVTFEEKLQGSVVTLTQWLRAEWMGETPSPALDSQEASEEATLDSQNLRLAQAEWRSLSREQKDRMQQAVEAIEGPRASKNLREMMAL